MGCSVSRDHQGSVQSTTEPHRRAKDQGELGSCCSETVHGVTRGSLKSQGLSPAGPSLHVCVNYMLVYLFVKVCMHVFTLACTPGVFFNYFNLNTGFLYYILFISCAKRGMRVSQCGCGDQGTACRAWFSPSVIWVPGVKLRL